MAHWALSDVPPTPEVAPLAPAVLEALAALPAGRDLPRERARLLTPVPLEQIRAAGREGSGRASSPRFVRVMRAVEASAIAPAALAEMWLWLSWLVTQSGSRAETTGQNYARTVGRFLAWCRREGVDHAAARIEDFDRWQRWLAIACGNGASWRAQQVRAVRNFYDWRRSRGIAATNLAADVTAPRTKPKPPRKYTQEHLRALFRAIEAGGKRAQGFSAELARVQVLRDRSAVLLLLSTGIRREELCNLGLDQLELGRRTGVVRIHGKGAKERDVPFEGPAVEALNAWLMERDSLPFACAAAAVYVSLGQPEPGAPLALRSYETMIARYAKRAKLKTWGVHRFRVTYATQLYDDGADIETIRALLGHESIETTRGYLAVSERARRTRLSADRQHAVLGTKPTGAPLWTRIAAGELTRG